MVLASAEIHQPLTGKFTLTGSMSMIRYKHAAVLLQDGNVLVIGGSNQNDWQGKYASAEIYDARAGTFTRTADLNRERFSFGRCRRCLTMETCLSAEEIGRLKYSIHTTNTS
jgi:hypothetical protein